MTERLNKHLATIMGISRREADLLIEKGRVAVDGRPAVLGTQVESSATVVVDGQPIAHQVDLVYLAMNKPVGYVCSRRSQGGVPTIYELLPKKYQLLKTVGRLDKDSSGLILLTNDGDFAFSHTHPKFQKTKQYNVRLDRDLEPLHQQMISDYGVTLEDGVSQLGLTRMSDDNRRDWTVTMSEGRNRQIRRTFSALGYTVVKLHRTQFGSYSLGDIKRGDYRQLNV